jgi:hypothetical protein
MRINKKDVDKKDGKTWKWKRRVEMEKTWTPTGKYPLESTWKSWTWTWKLDMEIEIWKSLELEMEILWKSGNPGQETGQEMEILDRKSEILDTHDLCLRINGCLVQS